MPKYRQKPYGPAEPRQTLLIRWSRADFDSTLRVSTRVGGIWRLTCEKASPTWGWSESSSSVRAQEDLHQVERSTERKHLKFDCHDFILVFLPRPLSAGLVNMRNVDHRGSLPSASVPCRLQATSSTRPAPVGLADEKAVWRGAPAPRVRCWLGPREIQGPSPSPF